MIFDYINLMRLALVASHLEGPGFESFLDAAFLSGVCMSVCLCVLALQQHRVYPPSPSGSWDGLQRPPQP